MSDEDRLRRERPERIHPNRDWTARTRSSERAPGSGDQTQADADGAEASDGVGEVVRKGVELGYRVIEEQIRQGQRVAEELSQHAYDPQAMSGDFRQATERMLNYYQDAGQLWIELLTTFLGSAGQMGSAFPSPFGFSREGRPPQQSDAPPYERSRREAHAPRQAGAPPSGENLGAQVPVEIASAGPVRVSLDLRPEAELQYLATTELPALDRKLRPLTGVAFEPNADGGPPTLRIHVPDGSTAGTYVGVVVDRRTGNAVGTLNVQVVA